MRILWFCSFSLSDISDKIIYSLENYKDHPATWIFYLSEAIKKERGVELYIISVSGFIPKDIFLESENITYHILSHKPRRSDKYFLNTLLIPVRYFQRTKLKRKIQQSIRSVKPDLINIHGTEHEFGHWINDTGSVPVLIWMQGVMNFAYRNEFNRASGRIKKREIAIFRKHNRYVSKKGNMETFISGLNKNAVFYNLYYPVSPFCFELGIKNSKKVFDFVFAGSLIQRKGIEDFIEALFKLKQQGIVFSAVVIGGAQENNYYDLILSKTRKYGLEANISFKGLLPEHKQVLKIIAESKILVLPTYADTAPVVIAESQACKTCVIAYNVDGVPGMVEHNETGILVELSNIDQLANSMSNLLVDDTKQKELIEKAVKYAEKEYHPKVVARNAVKIYSEIIKENKL